MAWIRWRETRRGRRAYVPWRDRGGRVRSKKIDTADERVAQAHLRIIEAREEGKASAPVTTDAAEALARFMAHLRLLRRAPATLQFYDRVLTPLFQEWANIPMSAWSPQLLEAAIDREDWSARTIQMRINACKRFVRWASESGVACPDFVRGVRGPTVRQPEPQALTLNQVQRLIQQVRDHYLELPIGLAAYAGLSLGDLYALTWKEVDLKVGFIRRARQKTGQRIEVPIVAPLREILQRRRALGGRVCRGLPKSESSLSKALHRACESAKIPPAPRGQGGWHRFRHTFATILTANGADLPTTQRLMSHRAGSAVTLRYLHTDEERMRAAMERAFGQ